MRTIEEFIGGNADAGTFTRVEFDVPPETVEDFLGRPAASADNESEEEWHIWGILKELFEDSRMAVESFTLYVWQNASANVNSISCVPVHKEPPVVPLQISASANEP
jgi:hypothetical protein